MHKITTIIGPLYAALLKENSKEQTVITHQQIQPCVAKGKQHVHGVLRQTLPVAFLRLQTEIRECL